MHILFLNFKWLTLRGEIVFLLLGPKRVSAEDNFEFSKMGHSRPLFLNFRLFNTQLIVNKCSI